MQYEVTIAIPVYNVEKYVRRALESALAQTFQSIEFLICDDCGSDSSMDIVREYQVSHPRGSDIHIVSQPQNRGIGEARNLLIDSAQGKYLYFMDADDAISDDAISLLHTRMVEYDADIVYGSHSRIEDFGDQVRERPVVYPSKVFLAENEFASWVYEQYGRMETVTWNFLISIRVFRDNGIRFQPINFWEDLAVTIDLPTYVTRVVLMPNITYKYYCRYGSLSNYQERTAISKSEIAATIGALEQVKANGGRISDRPYYPERCLKVMMTCFYMACSIIKNRKITHPPFTDGEIRHLMASPLGFTEICSFRSSRLSNLALFLLGVLPSRLTVHLIRVAGSRKGLI